MIHYREVRVVSGRQAYRRRGAMYVVVLGCAMLVTVIGLSAVLTVRVQRRAAEDTGDYAQARLHAESAIRMGCHILQQDPSWRDNYSNGVWVLDQPIGSGSFTLEGIDPQDGDLGNSNEDPLVFIGTGAQGAARYKLRTTLTTGGTQPLDCLEVTVHAGNSLGFDSASVQCDQKISANNTTTASGSMIQCNVEVVNTWNGFTYQPPPTSGAPPRTLPDAAVFDYYTANGATMNYANIPSSKGKTTIGEVVISPAINPYGTETNAEGIYVLDCAGQELIIANARILGTLVVMNVGLFSVGQSVNWEPAVANYPALMLQGSAEFVFEDTLLSETAVGINLNPPGAPADGVTDDDMTDTYLSRIKGLIYISGDVTTDNSVTINGIVVIGGSLSATAYLELTYEQTAHDDPPPGFGIEGGGMMLSPGSWRRVVDSN